MKDGSRGRIPGPGPWKGKDRRKEMYAFAFHRRSPLLPCSDYVGPLWEKGMSWHVMVDTGQTDRQTEEKQDSEMTRESVELGQNPKKQG